MSASIRFATTQPELAGIYRLRYDLYVVEQGLFTEEADHERRWLLDPHDAHSRLIMAEVDGEVVGTARVSWGADAPFDAEHRETYLIDRFEDLLEPRDILVGTRNLVRREHRGGAMVFRQLWKGFEFVGDNDIELVLGNCEPHLVGLYRRMGFRPYGSLYNHPTSGALVRMAFVPGDLDYLREIESPLLGAFAGRTRGDALARQVVARLGSMAKDAAPTVLSAEAEPGGYWDELTNLLGEGEDGLRAILGEMSHEDVGVVLAKSLLIGCDPGDALIRKGHASRTLYMLLAGSLEVHDHGKLVARVDQRGAVVGEVAFFNPGRRMSDVLAGPQGARVLALNDTNLREIIASHGPVAAKFLVHVARGLSQKLVERAQSG